MWRTPLVLLGLAGVATAAFFLHGMLTGIGVPYQDPTPEQAAYERFHHRVSSPLFAAAVLFWLLALVTALATGILRLTRRVHRS